MNRPQTVIHFVNAVYIIGHIFMLIFPTAVLSMTGSFDLDYVGLTGLSLGSFITFDACSLPASWLGGTWGRRRTILLFFFGIGTATLPTGLVGGVPMLVTGLTLIGVFAAIYRLVGTAMLVTHAENRGREVGIDGMWGNLGVAFTALLTGFLIAHFGWRAVFILSGGATIPLGIDSFFCVCEEPSPHPSAKAATRGEDNEGLSMHRVFDVLTLVATTGGVVFNVSTVTYPRLFQECLNDLLASPQTLGAMVSLAYAFGAVAQLIMDRLIDRLNPKLSFVFLTFCRMPPLLALAYGRGSTVVLFGALFMFVVFGQITVNDAMVARFVTPQQQARVFALRHPPSFGTGAVVIPMVAYLEPQQGLLGLYLVLAGFAVLILAAALVFPCPARSAAMGT